ncbi:MAG: hypothetical protein ACOX5G_08440 [Kiritimatiellia bacterium]|jgi:hypothetical protein
MKNLLPSLLIAFMALPALAAPTGVTINGTPLDDASSSSGPGWAYDPATCILRLSGPGPFTLSGENTEGAVRVVVPQGATTTITLSNLTLSADYGSDDICTFALETNACVSLFLKGENAFRSTKSRRARRSRSPTRPVTARAR